MDDLSRVEIHCLNGKFLQASTVEFLLFSSTSLTTMSIVEHLELEPLEALRITRKLLQLQLLAKTPVSPILSKSQDSLKIMKLKGVNFINFDKISAIVCLIRSAPSLHKLHIGLLAKKPVPPILSTSPDSLKIIELKGVNFINFDKISAIVCLIRSAPNLHKLHIGVSPLIERSRPSWVVPPPPPPPPPPPVAPDTVDQRKVSSLDPNTGSDPVNREAYTSYRPLSLADILCTSLGDRKSQ
ncbi:hypothetical protein HAX54_024909 [Datura stramonium]|uniref:Uncharacterized protein n=1 Tax=Datura stramonium TaxID=4076 RepID=A0ABS8S5R3_DATST|nr:hypothetical protein [Datura stramonium]